MTVFVKKLKNITLFLLVINMACCGNAGNHENPVNLIRNGSFELKQAKTSLPENWKLSKAFTGEIENDAADGNNCIALKSPDGYGAIIQKKVPLIADKKYMISYYVKTSRNRQGYKVYVEYSTAGKKLAGSCGITDYGKTQWQYKSFIIRTPEVIKHPYLVLLQKDKGKIWFDDVKINEIKDRDVDADNLLTNGDFKQGFDLNCDWKPQEYKGKPQIKIVEQKAGNKVLMIELKKPSDNGRCSQNVKVKPGHSYEVSICYKTSLEAKGLIYLMVIGSKNRHMRLTPDKQWKTETLKFSTSAKENKVKVLVIFTKTTGCLLVNKIVMKENGKKFIMPERKVERIFNPGFENDSNNDRVADGWKFYQPVRVKIDSTNTKSGKNSLMLIAEKRKKTYCRQDGIPCTSGSKYRLTVNVLADKFNQPYRFYVGWNRLKNKKNDYGCIVQRSGTKWRDGFTSWQKKTLEFAAPEKRFKDMYLVLETRGKGRVWFDDIILTKVRSQKKDKPFSIILTNPYYRNTIYASNPVSKISGKIRFNKKNIQNLQLHIKLLNKNNKIVSDAVFSNVRAGDAFSIPVSKMDDGYYVLEAVFETNKKKIFKEKIKIRKVKAAKYEVLTAPDNTIICNRKRFFPVGVYSADFTEYSFSRYNELGFNTILYRSTNAASSRLVLDKAAYYGLKVVTGYIWGASASQTTQHQAFLGYHNSDEPAWCGADVQKLIHEYQKMKDLDPFHPIWLNHAPRNTVRTLKNYNRACDISGVDIYPVSANKNGGGHSEMDDKTISCIGKYTLKMRRTVDDRKPVIMVLQGFAWDKYYDRKQKNARYPTYRESRFMVWDAIVHGAKGIFYYGTNHVPDEHPFWRDLGRVNQELRNMANVITAPKGTSFEVDNKNIAVMSKKYNGHNYLIAVNTSPESQKVKFSFSGFSKRCHILFTKRFIPVMDGSVFADSFNAYEVKFYSDSACIPASVAKSRNVHKYKAEKYQRIPFRELGSGLMGYPWKGSWVWSSKKPFVSKAFLRKKFMLETEPDKSYIAIAADASYKLYVNGKYIGSGSCWAAQTYNIQKQLQKGENVIAVAGIGDGGPTGILFEGIINSKDRKGKYFISDDSWKTSNAPQKGWKKSGFNDDAWRKAIVAYRINVGVWGKIPVLPPVK